MNNTITLTPAKLTLAKALPVRTAVKAGRAIDPLVKKPLNDQNPDLNPAHSRLPIKLLPVTFKRRAIRRAQTGISQAGLPDGSPSTSRPPPKRARDVQKLHRSAVECEAAQTQQA